MTPEIIVVSGLPRSGTSLMMQALAAGGVPVVTDATRAADPDNPRGYFELDRAKRLRADASWLPECRGKAVKLVSQLLYDLPEGERYRVVFMERDLDEVLASQETMLARRGHPAAPRAEMRAAFADHLARLREWLATRTDVAVLFVPYRELVAHPVDELGRVAEFLGVPLAPAAAAAVDPALYRNRGDGVRR